MKLLSLILILSASHGFAESTTYKNIVRQVQQHSGVVWDMQDVTPHGAASSVLLHESGGSLFQLWTIDQTKAKDYLLDQKLVGVYLPKADIKITSLDTDSLVPRTRVDQPFFVEIQVSDLLTGVGMPEAATKVLLEQHVQSYAVGQISLDHIQVTANPPASSVYVSENGKTVLKFPASSLIATDPTKASGEEHFTIHALTDASISQTQIASAHIQVWPVASGKILGITQGQKLRFETPMIQLNLDDLYPRSDTYLMLYEGTEINGTEGVVVKEFPVDRTRTVSEILQVSDLDSKITKNGTYSLALMSETVFGNELLCPPITFSVERTITINAMQTNFTDDSAPLAAP
jgi:hypothetical protein